MVLDDQFRPLHKLTKKGQQQYRQLLESTADEILFKHQHPIKWLVIKIKDFLDFEIFRRAHHMSK